jgi:hypothetical protein
MLILDWFEKGLLVIQLLSQNLLVYFLSINRWLMSDLVNFHHHQNQTM